MGAYAIFKKDDEVLHREIMNLVEIKKVRESSTSKGFSPWDSFFEEMARKTVVRRGAKYVIHSQKSNDVLERDNVFYDLDKAQPQKTALTPPSVKHLELDKKPEPEIQGEVEQATPEPEVATADDIPVNPETILEQLKTDLDMAENQAEVEQAWAANDEEIQKMLPVYMAEAAKLYDARLVEVG